MKKIYQNPTTVVVQIELQHIMALSDSRPFGEDVSSAEGAEARRRLRGRNVWDEEEEEEEDF